MVRIIRLRLLAALAVVIALGLLSRLNPLGWYFYDKSLGDVLYASAAYLILATIFVRQPRWRIAVAALAFCLAIETFKLTGIPEKYGRFLLVRWLLGSVFSWHNIVCYAGGIALMHWLDAFVLRMKRRLDPA